MGERNIAGIKFATFIFVIDIRLSPNASIITDPQRVISPITASFNTGSRYDARITIDP